LILDTNALSNAAEKNPAIIQILTAAPQLAIPVIALGEYSAGIARSRHAASYREWLGRLLADSLILDVTNKTTHHYAAIILELRQSVNQSQRTIFGLRLFAASTISLF